MDLIIKARKPPYGHVGYTRVVHGQVQRIAAKNVRIIVKDGGHSSLISDVDADTAYQNLKMKRPELGSQAVLDVMEVFKDRPDPRALAEEVLTRLKNLGAITVIGPDGDDSALGEPGVVEGPHGEREPRLGGFTRKKDLPELWASRELITVPVETPEPPSYATSFTYQGKNIKVDGLASRMLSHWIVLMRQHEEGQHRVRNWDVICPNFSGDFSDALKQKVDVSKLRMKDVEKAADLFERVKLKANEVKKKKTDAEKAKLKAKGKKPEAKKYEIMQNGRAERMAGGVLGAEHVFIGGGKGKGLGRWIPRSTYARSTINLSLKNRPSKKEWPGEVAEDTKAEWIIHENLAAGIRGQDPFPGKTKVKTTLLHKSTLFKRTKRREHFKGVLKLMDAFPKIQSDLIRDLKSPTFATRELAFALMVAHTMHARSGSGESDVATGILQFTTGTIEDDKGNYYFLAKDQIEADSKYHKQLKYTGKGPKDPVFRPPLVGGPGGLKSFPGALDVWHELVNAASGNPLVETTTRKGVTNAHLLFNQNMKLGSRMVAWLKARVLGVDGLKVHDFRAAHGNTYFNEEWAKHKHKLDALKKAGKAGSPEMKQAAIRLVNHCADVVAVKLGHRRREKVLGKKLTAEEKKKLAAKERSSAADSDLGSATTRGSYLDMVQVHEKCTTYGVTGLKPSEIRDVLGLPEWPPQKKGAKKSISYLSDWAAEHEPQFMKAMVDEVSEMTPEERWALTSQELRDIIARLDAQIAAYDIEDEDEPELVVKSDTLHEKYGKKIPTCRYCNRQAIYIIYTNTREKIPVCKVHMKLKAEMSKAILTKPSEKAPKPAKAPSKASGKSVSPQTGKKTYTYRAQNPTSGGKTGPKAGAKKKPPQQQAAVDVPQPPPRINVEELAAVLKTTVGALKHYAKQFRDADHFVSHFKRKAGSFTLKHKTGPDKLRRLYETLREDDTSAPRV